MGRRPRVISLLLKLGCPGNHGGQQTHFSFLEGDYSGDLRDFCDSNKRFPASEKNKRAESERSLVQRVQRGDEEAFTTLFRPTRSGYIPCVC